jgi:hypothetical protein
MQSDVKVEEICRVPKNQLILRGRMRQPPTKIKSYDRLINECATSVLVFRG